MTISEAAAHRLRPIAFLFWLDAFCVNDQGIDPRSESFGLELPEDWFDEWFQKLCSDPLPEGWESIPTELLGTNDEFAYAMAISFSRWRRVLP
jgi:hypothetical protein